MDPDFVLPVPQPRPPDEDTSGAGYRDEHVQGDKGEEGPEDRIEMWLKQLVTDLAGSAVNVADRTRSAKRRTRLISTDSGVSTTSIDEGAPATGARRGRGFGGFYIPRDRRDIAKYKVMKGQAERARAKAFVKESTESDVLEKTASSDGGRSRSPKPSGVRRGHRRRRERIPSSGGDTSSRWDHCDRGPEERNKRKKCRSEPSWNESGDEHGFRNRASGMEILIHYVYRQQIRNTKTRWMDAKQDASIVAEHLTSAGLSFYDLQEKYVQEQITGVSSSKQVSFKRFVERRLTTTKICRTNEASEIALQLHEFFAQDMSTLRRCANKIKTMIRSLDSGHELTHTQTADRVHTASSVRPSGSRLSSTPVDKRRPRTFPVADEWPVSPIRIKQEPPDALTTASFRIKQEPPDALTTASSNVGTPPSLLDGCSSSV